MEDMVIKRIIHGLLIESAAIAALCAGLFVSSTAQAEMIHIAGIAGLGGLAAWSLLTVIATLVSFDLIGA